MTAERLDDLISAIRLFKRLADLSRENANGAIGRFFPELKAQQLRKARIRDKAAARLSKLLAKECDKIKKEYEPKIWGGQLLGWTTQAEVDALDKSIATDY